MTQEEVYRCILERPGVTNDEIVFYTKLSRSTVIKQVVALRKKHMVHFLPHRHTFRIYPMDIVWTR